MELKLVDGRYVPESTGSLAVVSGGDELAQRVGMKLAARRGRFLPLPDFGSRLYLLPGIKPSQRENAAKQYIAEAVADETGLTLKSVSLEQNGGTAEVRAVFSYDGTAFTVTTGI